MRTPDSPLLARIDAQCGALARHADLLEVRTVLGDIAAHAVEPLRVAVTGDVSTGKSTLVNSLIGADVAAVQREECTAVATWYRDPVVTAPEPLDGHHRTEAVTHPLSTVVTLVDTPGVNTVSGGQKVTEDMVGAGRNSAGASTVLVYLCAAGTVSGSALRRLGEFTALTGLPFWRGLGTVLVGSKVDEVNPDDPAAVERNLAAEAGDLAGCTVALAPALAAAVRTGRTSPRLLEHLRTIAGDARLRRAVAGPGGWVLLASVARDIAPALADDIDWLERTTGTVHGLRSALEDVDAGDVLGAVRERWHEASGLDALERRLHELAAERELLTVHAVAGRLRHLWRRLDPAGRAAVAPVIEEIDSDACGLDRQRRAAALALRGGRFPHVDPDEQKEASEMLCGLRTGLCSGASARWRRRALAGGRSPVATWVAELVAEAADERSSGGAR